MEKNVKKFNSLKFDLYVPKEKNIGNFLSYFCRFYELDLEVNFEVDTENFNSAEITLTGPDENLINFEKKLRDYIKPSNKQIFN